MAGSKVTLAPLKVCAECADHRGRKNLWSSSGPQQVKQRVASSNWPSPRDEAKTKRQTLHKDGEASKIFVPSLHDLSAS